MVRKLKEGEVYKWHYKGLNYYIHGKPYFRKDWLKEKEKLLLEQHRLDILEEL